MKRIFCVLTLLMIAGLAHGQVVITSPVDHLYVPTGFDDNDNIEVIVTGKFKDTCHARNKYEVKVKDKHISITITGLNTRTQDAECETFSVPYVENVTIGNLPSGDYHLTVNNKLTGQLAVSAARTNRVDDHLYAMVDYVELGFTGGINGSVFLVGRMMECLALKRVEVISNGKDAVSILPIMEKVSSTCLETRKPFDIPVNFDIKEFKSKSVLLFVRTMDGKSVHTIIEK